MTANDNKRGGNGGDTPRKKAAAPRDWVAEQERFLAEIAPESHFYRAFDGLGDVFFFAKNLAVGAAPDAGPIPGFAENWHEESG